MQIRKSRGLGKIIEAAFEKSAAPRAKPMPGIQYGPEETMRGTPPAATKPQMSTGTPQAQAPAAKPAAAPAAAPAQKPGSQLPIPAGPHGPALQQEWMKLMQEAGPSIAKMGQWAQQMSKQPMVAKDPQFAASLNQFSQTIANLPQKPQSVPELQQQIQGMHKQLENFWLKWQDAYQRGHQFMRSSTDQLKAFEHFVNKKLNMKGFQNAATPVPQGQNPMQGTTPLQNMGGFA